MAIHLAALSWALIFILRKIRILFLSKLNMSKQDNPDFLVNVLDFLIWQMVIHTHRKNFHIIKRTNEEEGNIQLRVMS